MENQKIKHFKSSPFLAPFMSKMIIVTIHISERGVESNLYKRQKQNCVHIM
jgi:hypothetical protein